MNIVVHMTECKPGSTVASAKIARLIEMTLPFNLVDTKEKAEQYKAGGNQIENLMIVNGPMAFCDFLPELGEMVRVAEHVIWVQQDYTISPPAADSKAQSPFRKAFGDRKLRPIYWTTIPANIKTPYDRYVNWNQLTYEQHELPELTTIPILFYYGAYRIKREKDFQKYLANAPGYRVVLSTTTLRAKKFLALDSNMWVAPPFTSLGRLPPCSATLYIEDERSHREFHSPANRFYEMLSAGIPIFFDAATLPMLAEAKIYPQDKWVVRNSLELYNAMWHGNLKKMQQDQRDLWHADYKQLLINQLLNAWEEHEYQQRSLQTGTAIYGAD